MNLDVFGRQTSLYLPGIAMSSDEEAGGEMEEVLELQKLKEAYGAAMSEAEHLKRLKAIQAKWSGKLGKGASAKARAKFIWRDVRGKTAVVAADFTAARAQMPGDFKADPDCRSGILSNFKGNNQCKFRRRMAIIDGKHTRYRMVLLNNGKYCFQVGYDVTGDGDSDDDDDDDDEEDDKKAKPQAMAVEPPPAPPQICGRRGRGAKDKTQDKPEAAEDPPAPPGKRTRRK